MIGRLAREWSPIRWAKKWTQRARRGYSTEDTYGFDGYLAGVIAGGVAEIRANLHGYPPELEQADDPEGHKATAAWASILDLIVEGFTVYSEDPMANILDDDERNAAAAKVDQAKRLFVYWFGHLWD